MESVSTAENQSMECVLSPEKQSMVSSFLEIAVGQSVETAKQFLEATNWKKLEEALQLFYVGNENGAFTSSSFALPEPSSPLADQSPGREKGISSSGQDNGSDEVRAPLPVKRDVLYDDTLSFRAARMGHPPHEASSMVAFRNFNEEMKRPGVWEPEQGATSTVDNPRDNLASLYRPPFHLMYQGPFDKTKQDAADQDKWLIVNLQSTKEFNSHMLNRDTWANETVAQTIGTNFIFWQVYDDTIEGKKVCTYYNLVSIPVVLVLDPITGQKMRLWSGMIQPERLLEELLPFMDGGPKDHHIAFPHKRPRETSQAPTLKPKEDEELLLALAASLVQTEESVKDPVGQSSNDTNESKIEEPEISSSNKVAYPDLPEEPKVDIKFLCRVAFRLPDGHRLQRNFLRTDPIQLLWSFCSSLLEAEFRPFQLTRAIPGASKTLDYEAKLTFDESGLSNSMISVIWE